MPLARRSQNSAAVLFFLLAIAMPASMVTVAAFSSRGLPSASSIDGVIRRTIHPLATPSTEPPGGWQARTRTSQLCGATSVLSHPHLPSWRRPSLSRRRFRRVLFALPFDEDGPVDAPGAVGTSPSSSGGIYESPDEFNARTTVALVGGQALLIVAAAIAAAILGTPRLGLGSGFDLTAEAARTGLIATAPLFVLAFVLDFVEKSVPALKDVTMATQRSVLALLGGTFRPIAALGTALALGAAAGLGEEMLFRGVLQTELSSRFGDWIGLASSSVVFGALHAVTPLYALLASLASVYFGYLYMTADNLAVPIVCHGIYDVGALLWAHWTICSMTDVERAEVRDWVSPVEKRAER